MSIRYEGQFNFDAILARLNERTLPALEGGMEIVKTRALELVPRLTNELADSAEIVRVAAGAAPTVGLRFSTPYAKKQHEDMRLKHPRGGQAKYEEQALDEKTDDALAETARILRDGPE